MIARENWTLSSFRCIDLAFLNEYIWENRWSSCFVMSFTKHVSPEKWLPVRYSLHFYKEHFNQDSYCIMTTPGVVGIRKSTGRPVSFRTTGHKFLKCEVEYCLSKGMTRENCWFCVIMEIPSVSKKFVSIVRKLTRTVEQQRFTYILIRKPS